MSTKDPPAPEVSATLTLRERAEEAFRKSEALLPETIGSLTPERMQEILHELRVHQIELEMQNETLLQSQVDLDKVRALYFDLYDLAPVGYCTVSEKGLILQVNLTAGTMLGVPRGSLILQRFSSRISKEDQDIFYLRRKRLLETGEPQTCDLRMLKGDGETFYAHLQITAALDESGKPVLRVVLIDVTVRRLAEEDLQKLRTAVEQSANTIVITDTRGNIEYVNPAFEKSTGYTAAEAIGKNPRVLKSGLHERPFYCNLWATITSGKTWRGEFQNRRKDGSLYWESATITPVLDNQGETVAYIAIKEDITDRKALDVIRLEALERTEAANRAKSEFLAVMSHELRTPLNGVLGFAELLSETPLTKEQVEFARIITDCGNHLLQVVNDILDFSGIEKGHLPLESAPIAVASLVESAVAPSRKAAADKRLELLCKIDPGLPERITGDARRIRQILINLIGNAVKFTASGSVVVRATPSSIAGRPAVDFSIVDTGPGMRSVTVNRLFNPFMQADMTLRRPFEGTGLGLAISQRLAEAMGGTISVVSAPGQGSTFTLRIPEAVAEVVPLALENPLPVEAPSTQAGGAPGPRETHPLVLVVEDDASNSSLAGKMLEALGCQAEFAFDGQEAVRAYAPGKFSAILMDMQMPVLDGLTATEKIRALEGASGVRVPIIALTANVMSGDRERCLAAGMDDFLSKPFTKSGLASKLPGVAAG